jgi:predicted amidophosphoribosyltransferase
MEASLLQGIEYALGASCPCCGVDQVKNRDQGLCQACLERWPQPGPGTLRLPDGNPLLRVGVYRGSLRQSILRAKEEPHSPALAVLSRAMQTEIERQNLPPGCLVVPPASWKRRWQGWHLAEALAVHLARRLQWPILPMLRPLRSVQAQAGLGAAARRQNLQGAFAVSRRMQVRVHRGLALPQRVWLLDDVYTTGATWLECHRVIRALGVPKIGALMLAQVDFDGERLPQFASQHTEIP